MTTLISEAEENLPTKEGIFIHYEADFTKGPTYGASSVVKITDQDGNIIRGVQNVKYEHNVLGLPILTLQIIPNKVYIKGNANLEEVEK